MRADNIQMLNDTLKIFEQGYYVVNGRKVQLKLSRDEMEAVRVFLPDEIEGLKSYKDFQHIHVMGRCGHGCENMDSFSLARKRYHDCSYMFTARDSKEILVLNLANPVNPGGGVRRGARAQEEDSAERVPCCFLWKELLQRNIIPITETYILSWDLMQSLSLPRSKS